MTQVSRTVGEILFEQYLASLSLPFEFEKEHAGKNKRPDYTIEWKGQTVVFDVKDFNPPEKFPTGFGFFDPYTHPTRNPLAFMARHSSSVYAAQLRKRGWLISLMTMLPRNSSSTNWKTSPE